MDSSKGEIPSKNCDLRTWPTRLSPTSVYSSIVRRGPGHTTAVVALLLIILILAGCKTGDSPSVADEAAGSELLKEVRLALPGLRIQELPPADFVEDFSSYASEADFLADSRDIYMESSDDGRSRIHLEEVAAADSPREHPSQAMRFDWPDRTEDVERRCSDFSLGRTLDLRDEGVRIGTVTEIWAELYVRWPRDFTVVAPESWNCTSAPRLKTFFVQIFGAAGRFGLTVGPGFYHFGVPNDDYESVDYHRRWNDGEWHQIRVEVVLPNSSLATNGGEARWWVDGEKAAEFTGIETSARSIWSLRLGANMNQGPGQTQSNWYGRVSVWTSDPGW